MRACVYVRRVRVRARMRVRARVRVRVCARVCGAQQNMYECSAASEHVGPSRTRVLLRQSTLGQAERDFCCD